MLFSCLLCLFITTLPLLTALDSRRKWSRVRLPAVALSGNNLGQVVHTRVLLSPSNKFGTGQGAVMPCGWEGNRRSGVALAMRHRLQWFINVRAQGREMSTPLTPSWRTHFTFTNRREIKIIHLPVSRPKDIICFKFTSL